jgi:hypothetical protein
MSCMSIRRRHYCGVPRTILAICSHDQSRLQLLACSGFPKKRGPSPGDGWYLRVSRSLPPSFVTLLTPHVDGLDIHPMLDSFIGP